jgi:hypothetical protein
LEEVTKLLTAKGRDLANCNKAQALRISNGIYALKFRTYKILINLLCKRLRINSRLSINSY